MPEDTVLTRLPTLSRITKRLYLILEVETDRLLKKTHNKKQLDQFDIDQLASYGKLTQDLIREERELVKELTKLPDKVLEGVVRDLDAVTVEDLPETTTIVVRKKKTE